MSVEVMTWVFKHSEVKVPGRRLVLLSLADRADPDGTKVFPSIERIARDTRMSERGVRYALRALEDDGAIKRIGVNVQHNGTTEYVVLMTDEARGAKTAPLQTAAAEGGKQTPNEGATSAPEPSVEPSQENRPSVSAHANVVTFRGKRVASEVANQAIVALSIWANKTGQGLFPFTGRGKQSESLTRIVGAMLDYPEVVEFWPRMIERACEDPWWDEAGGPPGVGVVFGPRVVERSLAMAKSPARLHGVGSTGKRNGQSTPADYMALITPEGEDSA